MNLKQTKEYLEKLRIKKFIKKGKSKENTRDKKDDSETMKNEPKNKQSD